MRPRTAKDKKKTGERSRRLRVERFTKGKSMARAWNDATSARKYVNDGGEKKTMVLYTARDS